MCLAQINLLSFPSFSARAMGGRVGGMPIASGAGISEDDPEQLSGCRDAALMLLARRLPKNTVVKRREAEMQRSPG